MLSMFGIGIHYLQECILGDHSMKSYLPHICESGANYNIPDIHYNDFNIIIHKHFKIHFYIQCIKVIIIST